MCWVYKHYKDWDEVTLGSSPSPGCIPLGSFKWLVVFSISSQPGQCVWSYISFPDLATAPSKCGANPPPPRGFTQSPVTALTSRTQQTRYRPLRRRAHNSRYDVCLVSLLAGPSHVGATEEAQTSPCGDSSWAGPHGEELDPQLQVSLSRQSGEQVSLPRSTVSSLRVLQLKF